MKIKTSSIGLSLVTAFASSLCCIAPLLAIVAGTSSFAANFSWIEPLRPYFVGTTFGILGIAWYQKLKPQKLEMACCTTEKKVKNGFMQSTKFLGIVSLLALSMTAFPFLSTKIMVKNKTENTLKSIGSEWNEINVTGMSCASCEHHITSKVSALTGVFNVSASYANSNTIVEFDPNLTNIEHIKAAIDSTGYQSNNYKKIEK